MLPQDLAPAAARVTDYLGPEAESSLRSQVETARPKQMEKTLYMAVEETITRKERPLPGGPTNTTVAEPSGRASTGCIVAAYERSVGVAPVRDGAHEVNRRLPGATGEERDRKRKTGKRPREVATGREDQAAAQHAPQSGLESAGAARR